VKSGHLPWAVDHGYLAVNERAAELLGDATYAAIEKQIGIELSLAQKFQLDAMLREFAKGKQRHLVLVHQQFPQLPLA
jgi:hypothetical protein